MLWFLLFSFFFISSPILKRGKRMISLLAIYLYFRRRHGSISFSATTAKTIPRFSLFRCKRLWIYKSTKAKSTSTTEWLPVAKANLFSFFISLPLISCRERKILWCKSFLPTVTVIGSLPGCEEGTFWVFPSFFDISHNPSHLLRQIRSPLSCWFFRLTFYFHLGMYILEQQSSSVYSRIVDGLSLSSWTAPSGAFRRRDYTFPLSPFFFFFIQLLLSTDCLSYTE